MSDSIKVHCVDQEYWYIRRERCICGNSFKVKIRKLISEVNGEREFDLLIAECKECGNEASFQFEITGFGPKSTFRMSVKLHEEGIPMDRVHNYIYIPMEKAINFIKELAKEGDNLALDYIEEAMQYARNKFKSDLR